MKLFAIAAVALAATAQANLIDDLKAKIEHIHEVNLCIVNGILKQNPSDVSQKLFCEQIQTDTTKLRTIFDMCTDKKNPMLPLFRDLVDAVVKVACAPKA